jgi:hypothetical protein
MVRTIDPGAVPRGRRLLDLRLRRILAGAGSFVARRWVRTFPWIFASWSKGCRSCTASARFPARAGTAAAAGPVCEPAGVLDLLRRLFVYVVAVVLPLAGAVLAVVRFADGDRDDGLRLAAASVLGVCLYLLFVF